MLAIVKKLNRMFYFLKREFNLITRSPFGYWEIVFNPPKKRIKIEKYNPESSRVAKKVCRLLNKHFPELKVYYHGSSALKIAGKNDIDILLTCKSKYFKKYLPKLVKLFGDYKKRGRKYLNWELKKEGFDVEITLIDPESRFFREIIGVFWVLQSSKVLLKKYEELKLSSKYLSIREFEREKLYFFNKLLSLGKDYLGK